VKVDTSCDVPYAGGVSVDGRTVYIDRELWREVMCVPGVPRHLWVTVPGMSGPQIIRCWIEHEHTEKSVDDGDNPVDVYLGAHAHANAKEDETAVSILGKGGAERYNKAIKPGLARCLQRSVNRIRAGTFTPPKDLWCGPYLDGPTPTDLILIRGMKAKGVADAFKASKSDPAIAYRVAGRDCRDCKHMEHPEKDLSPCEIVCGRVQWNRQCQRWVERAERK
jgi:hypothetical protein